MADKLTFRLLAPVFFNGTEVGNTEVFEVSADSFVEAVDIAATRCDESGRYALLPAAVVPDNAELVVGNWFLDSD